MPAHPPDRAAVRRARISAPDRRQIRVDCFALRSHVVQSLSEPCSPSQRFGPPLFRANLRLSVSSSYVHPASIPCELIAS